MATALVEELPSLNLSDKKEVEALSTVLFKISGLDAFELELELSTTVRDVKKIAQESCDILPEHMRLLYRDRELKDSDTLECYQAERGEAVKIYFTAGHAALVGGGSTKCKLNEQRNPFTMPVRGLSGSKGIRTSRMSGRLGGMGLIRKYGILMKRQEFREKATEIGFVKYR